MAPGKGYALPYQLSRPSSAHLFLLNLPVNTAPKKPSLVDQILSRTVSWLEEDWPLNWDARFGRQAPMSLEIGFGNGGFFAESAAARPEMNYVGIEVSWGLTLHLVKRLEREALKHCQLLRGDAHAILERCFEPGTLHEININFPDPWRKARHHERRLIQPGFLELVSSRLVEGGQLNIATDHEDYANWIEETLKRQERLVSMNETPRVHEMPGRIQTKYEMKARRQGLAINYFVYKNHLPLNTPTVQPSEPGPMPNVTFKGQIDTDAVMKSFNPMEMKTEAAGEEVLVSLAKSWRDRDECTWMIEAHVRDGRLAQRLALIIVGQEPGSLIVRAAALGTPRATPGLKAAVHFLAQWVKDQEPGLSVVNSTVGPLDVADPME